MNQAVSSIATGPLSPWGPLQSFPLWKEFAFHIPLKLTVVSFPGLALMFSVSLAHALLPIVCDCVRLHIVRQLRLHSGFTS